MRLKTAPILFDLPGIFTCDLVDERRLARQDFRLRLLEREPRGAVDLRKLRLLTGLRRPFHRERVAPDRRRVAVALDRPGEHELAALLAHRRQRMELAVQLHAD